MKCFKLFCVAVGLLLSVGAGFAQSGTAGSLTWSISGNTLTFSGSGTIGCIMEWTQYSNSITNVVIENGITEIGSQAFQGYSELTSITIPNSVTSIGIYAFDNCSSLKSITIPNSVTSIGNYTFDNCSSLTSIIISNSVKSIGDRAFRNCSSLTSITIPNSVTSIGDYAFSGCSGLKSITIPNSVTSLKSSIFSGCSGLMSVTIHNSVTNIEDYIFKDCINMRSISLPLNNYSGEILGKLFRSSTNSDLITGYTQQRWYDGRYYYYHVPNSLKVVKITDNTTVKTTFFMGNEPAYNADIKFDTLIVGNLTGNEYLRCSTLKYFAITDGTSTTLSNGFLGGCFNLTDITLPFIGTSPTNPTTLCALLFNGNNSNVPTTLKKLTLVRSSTNIQIAANALSGLSQLTEITLSSNVRGLGEKALYGCNGLEHIYSEWANPPSAFNNSTFEGVNKYACVVHVPVGAKDRYAGADGWKEFYIENIQEEAAVTITARPVPLYGGIISGALQYNYDDNASITASGNMGYDFQGWMENDNIVSTNRTYTFLVEGARTLYAVFTPRENDNAVSVSSPTPTEAVISWDGEDGASSYTLIVYSDAARTHEYARFEFNADGTLRARGISTSASRFSQTIDNLIAGQQYYYTVTAYDSENYKLSIAVGNFTAGSISIVETLRATSLPEIVGYYSILGQKLPREPEHGLYIILYDNGKSEKVMKR